MNKLARFNLITEKGKIIFFVMVNAFLLFLLCYMSRLTIPLLFAYLLYVICRPIMPYLVKAGRSKLVAIVVIFLGLGFFTVYPIVKIFPIIKQEADNLQYYIPKVEHYLRTNYDLLTLKLQEKFGLVLSRNYLDEMISQVENGTRVVLINLPNYLASFFEWLFLVPLFLFFLLRDGRNVKLMILSITPNLIFERFYYLSHEFNRKLGDYILAKIIEASIVGVVITAGLFLMEVRFSLLLGLLAGLTNIIPYVGPIIGFVPGVIVGLVEYGPGPVLGAMVILYTIANVIDLVIIFPILVSKIVDLHPMIVVVSVILGSQYLGIVGMIISIPVAAALKLLLTEIYQEIYLVGEK